MCLGLCAWMGVIMNLVMHVDVMDVYVLGWMNVYGLWMLGRSWLGLWILDASEDWAES